MLESTPDGQVCVSVIVKGGAAQKGGLNEGDMIESIDGHIVARGAGVEHCSHYIRGASGSYVELGLRGKDGKQVLRRIRRMAVPGGSAEILGTLFQGRRNSVPQRCEYFLM